MIDFEKEKRAYEMLRWVPYSFPEDFDWEKAALGLYSKFQKERSDKALDQWEKEHPYSSSDEIKSFRELKILKVYGENTNYSPQKGSDGFYTKRLAEYNENAGRSTRKGRQIKKSRRNGRWLYDR